MSSPYRHSEQERIEALLIRALAHAKAEYEGSKRQFDQASTHRNDLGLNHTAGGVALTQATKAYNQALGEYRIALMTFNRFILDGKIPDDLRAK